MQYIGKPTFYTDFITLQQQSGVNSVPLEITGLAMATGSSVEMLCDNNPSNHQTITANGLSTTGYIEFTDTHLGKFGGNSGMNTLQILGHNLKSADAKITLQHDSASNFGSATDVTLTEVYGDTNAVGSSRPFVKNGSNIFTFDVTTTDKYWRIKIEHVAGSYNTDIKIGVIRLGASFTAPHAVNISEKQESSKKYKRLKSLGGNVFSYKTYRSQTWLDNTAPFYLSASSNSFDMATLAPSIKNYGMDFSYVADADYMNASEDVSTLQTDQTFSALYVQCLEGHLPVIMQKDVAAGQEDKNLFTWGYISKFKRTRIAPNLWNLSLEYQEAM